MSEGGSKKPTSDSEAREPPKTARDREAILARRRFFVASALAGVVAAGCDKPEPQVCLKVAPVPVDDGGPSPQPCLSEARPLDAEPMPCLEVARPEPDAGDPSSVIEPEPRVCLKVAAPPRDAGPEPAPRPCLKVAPKDDG